MWKDVGEQVGHIQAGAEVTVRKRIEDARQTARLPPKISKEAGLPGSTNAVKVREIVLR